MSHHHLAIPSVSRETALLFLISTDEVSIGISSLSKRARLWLQRLTASAESSSTKNTRSIETDLGL